MLKEILNIQEETFEVCLLINRQAIPIRNAVIRLGRHLDNDVVLNAEAVSRFHAEIHHMDGRYVLQDLDSTSGTFVNRRRVQRYVLESGDIISLANLELTFVERVQNRVTRSDVVTSSLGKAESSEPPAPGNYRIALVDDDLFSLTGLSGVLEGRGYQIVTALNAEHGLEIIRQDPPDLIISDLLMPDIDGLEFKRKISLEPSLANIPFVFLTSCDDDDQRVKGIRQGADDYITKPFHQDELFARIDAIFRRVETNRQKGQDEVRLLAQQEMDRLRTEIIQNIQHELRTPLTNVMMPLELAITQKFENPEEQLRFIQMAFSNLGRLESMVTDMILLADIDHGKLNIIRQPLDVDLHLLKPFHKRIERYKAKKLQVTMDIGAYQGLTAPRRELAHAAFHLLDNALKFAPEGGRVFVKLTRSGSDGFHLQVTDSGEGIPPELRKRVFERFFQISQGDTRNYEGLGVGLTIAREVAHSLGGKLEFHDTPEGFMVGMFIPASKTA